MDSGGGYRAGRDCGIIEAKNMNLKDYIGEATAYDKKLMLERKDPTSWLKSVSAFANTQGGKVNALAIGRS